MMGVLTSFLKLFKYNPATDGDSTFNIDTALNQNWDKVDTETKRLSDGINGLSTTVSGLSTTITNMSSGVNNAVQSVETHKADIVPHGKYNNVNDLVYTNERLTRVDEKIGGTLRKRTTLSYTGENLTGVNVKVYGTNGTTVTGEHNDVITYTNGTLSNVQRTVIL
ncbi:MAG: hypothetical protein K0S71_556 [Clostridia bacterium]|jgi:hypothetical protein|nr:hypothetical protein [Clostridia bacterium]